MNTHKFSGDMADQVEKDREELIRIKEVIQWASENVQLCIHWYDGGKWVWTARVKVGENVSVAGGTTLYEALRVAWENRDK